MYYPVLNISKFLETFKYLTLDLIIIVLIIIIHINP